MLWVTLGGGLESVFLGRQDLGPSVCEQILISLVLLLLLFQTSCSGYKPALKVLLLYGILRYAEFIVDEAHLVFGGRHIVVILHVSICRLFLWADLPVFLLGLFKGRLIRMYSSSAPSGLFSSP